MYTMDEIKEAVNKGLEDAIRISDKMYEEPEIGFEEVKSSKMLVEYLRDCGYEVEYPFLAKELGYGTAFRAVLKNGDGPSVALLAEYDALPTVGHGCGHNLSGAISALAGKALSELKDKFQGTIYVIGAPAEEIDDAKIVMEEVGVFEGMSLATMIHSHHGGKSEVNLNTTCLRCYEIEFIGKTAHSVGDPWNGHNALAALRGYLSLVDMRRECFFRGNYCNSIILSGGEAPNCLPANALVRTEFRTQSLGELEAIDKVIRKCAEGAAMAMDCTANFKLALHDFWDMIRLPKLEERTSELMEKWDEPLEDVPDGAGSTGMGNVSYQCPSIHMMLSISDEKLTGHSFELAAATVSEKGHSQLAKGGCIMTDLALTVLNDQEFRDAVYNQFVEKRDAKVGK